MCLNYCNKLLYVLYVLVAADDLKRRIVVVVNVYGEHDYRKQESFGLRPRR